MEQTLLDQRKADLKQTIADRIDHARKIKNLRKKDLADLMNRNDSEISKWLSGKHNFTLDTLTEIEHFLGVELLNPKIKYCNPSTFKFLTAQPQGFKNK